MTGSSNGHITSHLLASLGRETWVSSRGNHIVIRSLHEFAGDQDNGYIAASAVLHGIDIRPWSLA